MNANDNNLEVTINGKTYHITGNSHCGRVLKEHAGIPHADTLFLNVAGGDDAVVHNDVEICVKPCAVFYSCPPAKYGDTALAELRHDGHVEVLEQPTGWQFVILHDFAVPKAFTPERVRLLIKLPPQFPDAQPDMFWVLPHLRLRNGAAPHATSTEQILQEAWQRFSWHLEPGSWRPGMSRLLDFVNCIRGRLATGN